MSRWKEKVNKPTNGPTLLEAYTVLSARECSVLTKLGQGKSNRQIAADLYLAEGTVENHITRIGKKLGLNGRGVVKRWVRSRRKS